MPKNHRLLKGIVITLGILIVAMVILLIVASVMKYNDQKKAEAALVEKYQSSRAPNPDVEMPFNVDLELEDGEKILSTDASDRGIIVRIGNESGSNRIIIIDYQGNIIGTINIK